mmetsp:Transcript_34357/g.107777  ORF Transcript_34357/g.107777 Transcript_34357/m.107777 type:complete len:205 (-) Transcript_34357:291-905(-)
MALATLALALAAATPVEKIFGINPRDFLHSRPPAAAPPIPYKGTGCYEDHACGVGCPKGYVSMPDRYVKATSDMCSDFCCPISRLHPPPPPVTGCELDGHAAVCKARTDQPECFKAYAAKKAEAGKSGLPGRYFEQILQCSCENKPPELCINALEAEPTAAAAPPPELYLALGGITAAGAGAGAAVGLLAAMVYIRRKRKQMMV